jgi:hypothetical protein
MYWSTRRYAFFTGFRTVALRTVALRTVALRTVAFRTVALRTVAFRTVALRTVACFTLGLTPAGLALKSSLAILAFFVVFRVLIKLFFSMLIMVSPRKILSDAFLLLSTHMFKAWEGPNSVSGLPPHCA